MSPPRDRNRPGEPGEEPDPENPHPRPHPSGPTLPASPLWPDICIELRRDGPIGVLIQLAGGIHEVAKLAAGGFTRDILNCDGQKIATQKVVYAGAVEREASWILGLWVSTMPPVPHPDKLRDEALVKTPSFVGSQGFAFRVSASLFLYQAKNSFACLQGKPIKIENDQAKPDPEGDIVLDSLTISSLSPVALRTLIRGHQLLTDPAPDVGFTLTIDEALAPDPATRWVTATATRTLSADFSLFAFLTGLVLGAIGGLIFGPPGAILGYALGAGGAGAAGAALKPGTPVIDGIGAAAAAAFPTEILLPRTPADAPSALKLKAAYERIELGEYTYLAAGWLQAVERHPSLAIVGDTRIAAGAAPSGHFRVIGTDLRGELRCQWGVNDAPLTDGGAEMTLAFPSGPGRHSVRVVVRDQDDFEVMGAASVEVG